MKRFTFRFILGVSVLAIQAAAPSQQLRRRGLAEHVVVVVWDGMRPDFVQPQWTPTLCRLTRAGVRFAQQHPVYVSSTEVNGTALATGAYPRRSGIIANKEYLPRLNWLESVATEGVDTIRRGDAQTGGHYLGAPTLAELLQQAGMRTVVAGTKPVALLQDRANPRTATAARASAMVYNGHTIPSSLLAEVVRSNGKAFPTNTYPNTGRDTWTVTALTQVLWKPGVPKFSLLWLSEPDASQHEKMPGSPTALAALASSDQKLGRVLQALSDHGVLEQTDVFVVSDHGFSSVERGIDVVGLLKGAGFKAASKLDDPEPGEVLVVGLGGSALLYVIDHEAAVASRLVQYFQTSEVAGVIFSRTPQPGTFPLQMLLEGAPTEPDLLVSLRWSAQTNTFGTPGLVVGDGVKKGTGTHSSLSRFDMHNTLVACGPDFRAGFVDDFPTGNADLAPTILRILGITPPDSMDGRVLTEALTGRWASTPNPVHGTLDASADLAQAHWRQYLRFTAIGPHVYFDEGNGESQRRP